MEEVDIFNSTGTDRTATDTPEDEEVSRGERTRPGKANGGESKTRKFEFKPVYGLIVLVIATAIWVAYPMLVSTPSSSRLASVPVPVKAAASGQQSQSGTRQGRAEAPASQATAQGFQAQSNSTPAFADSRDALEPDAMPPNPPMAPRSIAAPAPTKAQVDAMIAVLQQQAAEAQANQQVLLQSLAELKTAVLELKSAPAAPPAPAKPAAVAAAPKRSRPAAPPAPRRTEPHKQAVARTAVAGLKLNTVYPGQAWIDAADGTHVVQVGDVIDGARVLSIDPASRRVVTTNGDIR